MNADVEVRQVRSDAWHPKAYLNIDHSDGYISAWTYCGVDEDIVIVGFDKGVVFLFRFESQEYYEEWLDRFGNNFDKIIQAKDLK